MRKDYPGKDLVVSFDLTRCIHSANCLRAVPAVFDVNKRPWIATDAAPADAIAAAIARCPSGALQYRRLDGGPEEAVASPPTIVPFRNGPLLVRGDVQLNGASLAPRAALCRCGQSANKPYCDNTHRKVGFTAD